MPFIRRSRQASQLAMRLDVPTLMSLSRSSSIRLSHTTLTKSNLDLSKSELFIHVLNTYPMKKNIKVTGKGKNNIKRHDRFTI